MPASNTVAIVQARMGSNRFPSKMMELLGDVPLIEWVLRRTKMAMRLDNVVLATTREARDDVLTEVADRLGVGVFRGSSDDVLDRYARAAKAVGADTVVRICADRPLVDPHVIDAAVSTFFERKPDLTFNHISEGAEWWPRGFGAEVLSAELLYWIDSHAVEAEHREHVTLYVWQHRDRFTIVPAHCPPSLDPGIADLRLDVDEPEDLQLLRELCTGVSMDVTAEQIVSRWRALKAA